jgi:hypothetical protein
LFPSLPRYVSALFIGRHGIDKAMQDISGEMTPWLGIRGQRRLDRSLLLRPAGTRTHSDRRWAPTGAQGFILSVSQLIVPLIPKLEIRPAFFCCPFWGKGVICCLPLPECLSTDRMWQKANLCTQELSRTNRNSVNVLDAPIHWAPLPKTKAPG